nr:unnamed protein product [Callosobruchus chinensis]
MYVRYLGDIFLQMLKGLILPLIVSSLISAITNLDLSLSGKIAARAIGYYLTTTSLSVILGIILVVTIKPGVGQSTDDDDTSKVQDALIVDSVLDLGRSLFPPNLVDACIFQYRTRLIPNASESDKYKLAIETEKMDGTNILGLLITSVAIGVAILHLKQEAEAVAEFFKALMAIMMKITKWVILYYIIYGHIWEFFPKMKLILLIHRKKVQGCVTIWCMKRNLTYDYIAPVIISTLYYDRNKMTYIILHYSGLLKTERLKNFPKPH